MTQENEQLKENFNFRQLLAPKSPFTILSEMIGTEAQFEYTDGTHSNIDLQKFHQQIESMMGKTSDTFLYGSKTAWSCNLCGKEATQGQIRRHIESKHITGVRHKCDLCDKSSKSRYALKVHKKRNH